MIHVVAMMTAKPGCRAELLKHFLAVLPLVHAEDGCHEYRPVIDNDAGLDNAREPIGPDTYIVIEKWTSVDALNAHAASDHMRKYGESVRDLIDSRVIHVLRDPAN